MGRVRRAAFKFKPFSAKQKKILTWWLSGSGVSDADGIIADGAIRSGKTVSMSLSFALWAMETFNEQNFGMCGKTIGSFRRNVLFWLKRMLSSRGYRVADHRADNLVSVSKGKVTNYFYVFGGKDERSQDLIQGITLAGCFFDEVALMPESFINQATGRCSVDGSKFWFNCNPEGPFHWFKKNWIDKADEKSLVYLHFTMEDNLSLSEKIKARYRSLYSGVFFDRYIRGLWVLAEGLIYEFEREKHTTNIIPPHGRYYISVDYGTLNPFSAGLWCLSDGVAYRIREYYYSGRERQSQLTDEEYYAELEKLAGNFPIECVVVDPSAASFITTIRRHSRFSVRKARNEVLDGIRLVSMLLRAGRIKIHENCEDAIREFGLYAWDDKPDKTEIDRPLKINDHAMDDIRYFCSTVLRRELRGIPELRGMKDDD